MPVQLQARQEGYVNEMVATFHDLVMGGSITFPNSFNVLHVRVVLVAQDLRPNLDDNAVNLSALAGLCTTFVSLFGSAKCSSSGFIK